LKSIRRHLLAWLLSTLSLCSVGLALVLYAVTLEEMGEVFDEQLKQVALTVLTHFDGSGKAAGVATPASAPAKSDLEDLAFVTQVWTLDGQRLFSSLPDAGIPFVSDEGSRTVHAHDGQWRVYTDRSAHYLIQAAQPMETRHQLAADIALKFLLASAATIPLLAALLTFALRRGLLPLTQTSHEVEQRSALSLEPIATEALPAELHPLIGSLNALMAKLSAALSAQREFIADAAHELRTPLTALRLQVQVLLLASDDGPRHEAAADIRHGLDRATHLVEQLLNLSRVEPNALPMPQEPVDMASLARAAVADFNAQAEARRIDLGADIAPALEDAAIVLGDGEQLRVLLNNLVDNALRHTPPGGRVDVRLASGPTAGTLLLEVRDSGPGIAPEERERVFDRFYRGTGEHRPHSMTPGSGLGLAIVRAIVERHGATIELADGLPSTHEGPGLAVRVLLLSAASLSLT